MRLVDLFLFAALTGVSAAAPAAYTTYATANAWGGAQSSTCVTGSFDPESPVDFRQDSAIDGESSTSASVINQQLDATRPSGLLFRRQSLATARADAGVLKVYAGAGFFVDSASLFIAGVNALAGAGFADTFTLVGPAGGQIDLDVEFAISGSLGGLASLTGDLSIGGNTILNVHEDRLTPRRFFCVQSSSICSNSVTLSLPVNTPIALRGDILVGAAALGFGNFRDASADFDNTGKVFLHLTDARYQLVTASGFNYAPAPVPVPATLALFVSGLLGLYARSRRRACHRTGAF